MLAREFTYTISEGDILDIEFSDRLVIGTRVVESSNDYVIVEADEQTMNILTQFRMLNENSNLPTATDSTSPIHGDNKHDTDRQETNPDRARSDKTGEDYDDKRDLDEAEYQGRKVALGKPMKGDVKKSKVYVKGPKGNVVKVNFGDPNMKIKKSNPKRRKSFRARHNCANPGPRWKARYWSCRAW